MVNAVDVAAAQIKRREIIFFKANPRLNLTIQLPIRSATIHSKMDAPDKT